MAIEENDSIKIEDREEGANHDTHDDEQHEEGGSKEN